MTSVAKRIAASAATVVFSALAIGGLTGTAQAATAGTTSFQLCNNGSDYRVSVVFPDREASFSYVLSPSQCWTHDAKRGEQFYLEVEKTDNPIHFATTLDRTNNSSRTVVTTKNNFASFAYDKRK